MLFVSVPGYSIHKHGKDHYAVALTNGNIGAGIIHKKDFDKFVQDHNGKDYRKAAKKVAVGAAAVGLVTAGIIFRKPIAETAKKVFEAAKNSEFVKKASVFAKDAWAKAKTVTTDVVAKAKDFSKDVIEKVKNFDYSKIKEIIPKKK